MQIPNRDRGAVRAGRKLAVVLALGLAGCIQQNSTPAGGTDARAAAPVLRAETVLPPGQSGFFSAQGQAQGFATGDPAAWGPHVDDQRLLYWSFDAKSGALGSRPGEPSVPKPGVLVYRDSYGVPIVYADTVRDLWHGVGYAVAQDRLFLMDAVRRTASGTLAALVGCGSVAADIQQRVVGYSDAEYERMFAVLSSDSQQAIQGYIDGANAWLAEVQANPELLPLEYAVLSAQPEAFTVRDVLASGVYITRFVAAEGGNEFLNIRMLRELEAEYGSRAAALAAFKDMVWLEDPKAVTSVPREEGVFPNHPRHGRDPDAVLRQQAAWALGLPETIWKGPGTGHARITAECGALRGEPQVMTTGASSPQAAALAAINAGLQQLREKPRGASFALAIGKQRTRDGGTLLISAPQLGYSYPPLLVEYEIHGAGYHARGVSVPILPVVGIGYSEHLAWALTTGYSKTIDSFVETICSTAQQEAGTCLRNQYWHEQQWKSMDCRPERVSYRASVQGLPTGPANLATDVEVCRTVHGPVVARDEPAGLARSLSFAMFHRELETMEGIREWNRARSFAEFHAAVARVTWNENVIVASRDGHIAFYHPGLHPRRAAAVDPRLPVPGTGEFDHHGLLRFAETPKVIDPQQGFVANWNNKPAFGWSDGEGLGSTSRPGGAGQRVTNLIDQLAASYSWRFEDLRDIDRRAGILDPRAREYLPLLRLFRQSADARLTAVQRAALDRILGWDRQHYADGLDIEDENATDTPGATLFDYLVVALRDELFGHLNDNVLDEASGSAVCGVAPQALTVYGRVAGVGSHRFDHAVMDNLILRVLHPDSSGLPVHGPDYKRGRSRDAVLHAALETALARLARDFNDGQALAVEDLDRCRRLHPRSRIPSVTEVVGPGSDTVPGTVCVTMPYQDRGSWVHRVGYERP